jgi:hypothetical protein
MNNIENSKFILKIREKLTIEIVHLKIQIPKDNGEKNSDTPQIVSSEILDYINLFGNLFEKIYIKNFQIDNIKIDLLYKNGKLFSKIDGIEEIGQIKLKSKISSNNLGAKFQIDRLSIEKFEIDFSGETIFIGENGDIFSKNRVDLDKNLSIHIFAKMEDFDKVDLSLKSSEIKSLKYIFDLFALGENAYIWGVEKAQFQNLRVEKARTNFTVADPLKALKNLRVDGKIDLLKYRFEDNLQKAELKNVQFHIFEENLHLNIREIVFGENILKASGEIKNLFSKPHLYIFANSENLRIDQNLERTIKYYSKLEDIPVALSSLDLNYFFDMKLYDDLKIRFLAETEIREMPISEKPQVGNGNLSFLFPENRLNFNNLSLRYGEMVEGNLSGEVDLISMRIGVDGDISKIYIDENSSLQNRFSLNLFGEINSTLYGKVSSSNWKFANMETNLSNFSLEYRDLAVDVLGLKTYLKDFDLSTDLNLSYNIQKEFGRLDLGVEKIEFSELKIEKDVFSIWFSRFENLTSIEIPKLLVSSKIGDEISLKVGDLSLLTKYIPIAKKYPELNGFVNVNIREKDILTNGNLDIPQRVIKEGDFFVDNLSFNGKYIDNNLTLSVNDKIFVSYNQRGLKVLIDGYDFNVTGINDFILEDNSTKDEVADNKEMNIEPKIDIFLKNSKIYLTDTNNSISTKLSYVQIHKDEVYLKNILKEKGEIVVKTKSMKYIVKATNLGENFITDVSNFHGIVGGDYNLYLKGNSGNFDGILQFKKLKLKDMDLVNNILAFINTVPALLTFSRPGFNHNGLRIIAGYADFEKVENKIFLKEIVVKGETVDIVAKGYIDLEASKISLQVDISAVKYVDKFIENIPIANYLILGDDGSIATRILVRGDLSNPKISTEIHKDLLYTPLEVTKRAFNLPAKILELFKELNINDNKNQESIREFFQLFK